MDKDIYAKICEFCECKFYNKNKVYCSKLCHVEHMKASCKRCLCCGGINRNELYEGFCSAKCHKDMAQWQMRNNLEMILRLHSFDLISLTCYVKDKMTGKIKEKKFIFLE
jgi:hypothetical protein